MIRSGNPDEQATGRAIVLHPVLSRARTRSPESGLAEAVGLAAAIDLLVLDARVVRVMRPRPATLIGAGTVEEVAALIKEHEAGLVVVDTALTPVQQRNLERAWSAKVIDRTGLILEIFGARARTREGRLQVELAALTYQRTRLVRSWTHLERQRGGAGFLGGPGEAQIELDRRILDDRILHIRRDLEEVRRTRELHRESRRRMAYPVVALVGYTNAGKSTLFNRLTRAGVLAKDQLFATLDPTMRAVGLPSGRKVILSDTVGFISDLPTQLVAAFRATLEEVIEADLILHVRDVADPETAAQKADVEAVLEELGMTGDEASPRIEVLNKIDLLGAEERVQFVRLAEANADVATTSATTGEGCDELMRKIDSLLSAGNEIVRYSVPLQDGAALAWLYEHGQVLTRSDEHGDAHLEVSIDATDRARFERRFLTPE